jgi:hypothetical protein
VQQTKARKTQNTGIIGMSMLTRKKFLHGNNYTSVYPFLQAAGSLFSNEPVWSLSPTVLGGCDLG